MGLGKGDRSLIKGMIMSFSRSCPGLFRSQDAGDEIHADGNRSIGLIRLVSGLFAEQRVQAQHLMMPANPTDSIFMS